MRTMNVQYDVFTAVDWRGTVKVAKLPLVSPARRSQAVISRFCLPAYFECGGARPATELWTSSHIDMQRKRLFEPSKFPDIDGALMHTSTKPGSHSLDIALKLTPRYGYQLSFSVSIPNHHIHDLHSKTLHLLADNSESYH